jgi:release factor glutamine methyltransferase
LRIYDAREAANIAEIVFESITKKTKIERIISQNELINEYQTNLLNQYTEQLLAYKPVQYVLNEAWFAGMKFYVTDAVLIPRPETDELVDWVVSDNKTIKSDLQIIDIGTGSGCIPISIKKKITTATVIGIDTSLDALEVARKNAQNLDTEINFKEIDFLNETCWDKLNKYDIIVSNPPYIKEMESIEMGKNVIDFEPYIALFVADNDPLLFYRKIALFAEKHLTENGSVYVEINEALGKATVELFINYQFDAQLKQDLQGKDRMIKAWKR